MDCSRQQPLIALFNRSKQPSFCWSVLNCSQFYKCSMIINYDQWLENCLQKFTINQNGHRLRFCPKTIISKSHAMRAENATNNNASRNRNLICPFPHLVKDFKWSLFCLKQFSSSYNIALEFMFQCSLLLLRYNSKKKHFDWCLQIMWMWLVLSN